MSGHLWLQKLGIPQFAISPRDAGADLETAKHQASLSGFLHSLFPLPGTLSTWLSPSSLLLVCSLGITVFWRLPWPLPVFPSLGSCLSRAFPGGLCPPSQHPSYCLMVAGVQQFPSPPRWTGSSERTEDTPGWFTVASPEPSTSLAQRRCSLKTERHKEVGE